MAAARLSLHALSRSSRWTTSPWTQVGSVRHERMFLSGSRHSKKARCFSSHGTLPLRNASTSSLAPTAVDAVVQEGSETSASIMQPLVPYIEQLPVLLHLPPSAYSYSISIVILTFALRSFITLPVTLWQRKRTRRMTEMVVPRWDSLKERLPEVVAKRCRRQGKNYEEYEEELKKELKSQLRALMTKYKCSPIATLAGPLLVHIPLFISVSLLIRTSLMAAGSPLSTELIPWWSPPPELMARFETSARLLADRGLEGEVFQKLTTVCGPTLSEVDKTMVGPVAMGVLTTANVELGQWLRRGMISEKEVERKHIEKHEAEAGKGRASAKRVEVELAPLEGNRLGNILRALAIAFVAVSSQAPAGLVVYWLTSASYTLVQNSLFAAVDRQRLLRARRKKERDADDDDGL